MKTEFVYTTYIKTTPQKLWKALTTPESMRQYWSGMHIKTSWKPGSPWQLLFKDGQIADGGEIVEFEPSKRLVLKWRNEWNPPMKAEGNSRCVVDIEPCESAVKLTITHSMQRDKSKFIKAVSGGWPFICSNLKSLLETGDIVLGKKALKKEDCR